MGRTIGSIFGISKQTEVLIMTVFALWSNIFDMALFDLSSNLDQVWSANMDATKFPDVTQHTIKMILSSVVLIQTFSLHIYIAFLIVMFWPASFASRPTLMLPWLLVSFIKNLVTGFITLGMGMFTCYTYGAMRPACVQFLASQFVDYAPSVYMWVVGVSYYRDLKKPKRIYKSIPKQSKDTDFDLAVRRRKVKSMADENILRNQIEARRKYFGTSAVIVDEIYKISPWDNIGRVMSRSLDSLLDALAVEAEFLELDDFEEIEEGLTVPERTAKLLGVSTSEIARTIQNKQVINETPIYPIKFQKKCTLLSDKLKNESRLKSSFIVNTLLTGTTLYNPTNKPIRPTKSELKSAKDFLQIKAPTEFIKSLPDREVTFYNFDRKPDTNTIFLAHDPANAESVLSQNISNLVIVNESSSTFPTTPRRQLKKTLDSGDILGQNKITKLPNWVQEHAKEKSYKDIHLQEKIIGKTVYGRGFVVANVQTCFDDFKTERNLKIEIKNKIKTLKKDVATLFDNIAEDKEVKEQVDAVPEDKEDNEVVMPETVNRIVKNEKKEKKKSTPPRIDKGYKHFYRTKGLQVYPKKYSDCSVQASTLSRKILDEPATEMTIKLATPRAVDLHLSPKTSAQRAGDSFKLSIPLAEAKVSSKNLAPKSGEVSPKSPGRTRDNSYVEIHGNRFEMDKFGACKPSLVEDGYSRMYKESYNIQAGRKISGAQLD